MSANDPYPVAVDLDRAANTLEIEWEDGVRTRYDGAQLRWACPCAECHGEMGSPGRLDAVKELPVRELLLRDVSLVGQYALGIGFESGHSTGIYTYKRLRDLGR